MANENTIEAQLSRFAKTLKDDEQKAVQKSLADDPSRVPAGERTRFDKFIQDERDKAFDERRARQKLNDPGYAIPLLANKVMQLEEKLRVMELDTLAKEDPDDSQIEENTQNIEDTMASLSSIRGTGYNLSPRPEADGSIEIFGRYNGPFYAEPLIKDQQVAVTRPVGGAFPYSDTLRVYKGVVYAGNSTFFWPGNISESSVPYRDFKFDHDTLGTSPSAAAGNWIVYMEVAAYPAALQCDDLWKETAAQRYTPVLRALNTGGSSGFPNQNYSRSDHTQVDDMAVCATTGGGNPFTRENPRGLDSSEDILVGKFILGTLTLGTDEESTRVEINKWEPRWHASDIYCPVWQWVHCTDTDGIGGYPDADTLECIYGASLCSPICLTPWGIFTDHYHKAADKAIFSASLSDETTYPYEDDCGLNGQAPAGDKPPPP